MCPNLYQQPRLQPWIPLLIFCQLLKISASISFHYLKINIQKPNLSYSSPSITTPPNFGISIKDTINLPVAKSTRNFPALFGLCFQADWNPDPICQQFLQSPPVPGVFHLSLWAQGGRICLAWHVSGTWEEHKTYLLNGLKGQFLFFSFLPSHPNLDPYYQLWQLVSLSQVSCHSAGYHLKVKVPLPKAKFIPQFAHLLFRPSVVSRLPHTGKSQRQAARPVTLDMILSSFVQFLRIQLLPSQTRLLTASQTCFVLSSCCVCPSCLHLPPPSPSIKILSIFFKVWFKSYSSLKVSWPHQLCPIPSVARTWYLQRISLRWRFIIIFRCHLFQTRLQINMGKHHCCCCFGPGV